jgi:hypothetical protein
MQKKFTCGAQLQTNDAHGIPSERLSLVKRRMSNEEDKDATQLAPMTKTENNILQITAANDDFSGSSQVRNKY